MARLDSPTKLSGNLSVYLDALRLFAAFMVFLDHSRNFLAPWIGPFGTFGRESVAVFFVLSGFVIAFVYSEKEHDALSYVVARFARIYPVALLAIGVTFVADSIGTHFAPGQYQLFNAQFHFYRDPDLPSLLTYLTFTNEIWLNHSIFGTGEPYWSLGFEVWYYVLFGLFAFGSRRLRPLLVLAGALICGVKIILYLPLWVLGCCTYHLVTRRRLARGVATVLFVLSLLAGAAFLLFGRRWLLPTNMYQLWSVPQEVRNVVYFYLLGLAVAANIAAFNSMTEDRKVWSMAAAKAIRWAAGASFTLYLTHQSIEVLLSSLFPAIRSSKPMALLSMAAVLVAVLLLAEIGERRKKFVSVHVRAALQRISRMAAPGGGA